MNRVLWTIVVSALSVAPVVADHWPQFRGTQAGLAPDNPSLPASWSRTQNVVWKLDVPGRSWSSPVVWGDHVFVTTVVNVRRSCPDAEAGARLSGADPGTVHSTRRASRRRPIRTSWVLYDVDFRSGRIRWERSLHTSVPSEPVHQKNTYFSETPVTDGERVYVYAGSIGLFAFDMSGKPVWSKPMPTVKSRMGWGTAASPVVARRPALHRERQRGAARTSPPTMRRSGRELWRVNRDEAHQLQHAARLAERSSAPRSSRPARARSVRTT